MRIAAFYFAMCVAQADEVLPNFLFYHHTVWPISEIVSRWSARIHTAWADFSKGMWAVIRHDQWLSELCPNAERAAEYFFPGIGI
jgi:hypothetical protein